MARAYEHFFFTMRHRICWPSILRRSILWSALRICSNSFAGCRTRSRVRSISCRWAPRNSLLPCLGFDLRIRKDSVLPHTMRRGFSWRDTEKRNDGGIPLERWTRRWFFLTSLAGGALASAGKLFGRTADAGSLGVRCRLGRKRRKASARSLSPVRTVYTRSTAEWRFCGRAAIRWTRRRRWLR